MLKDIYLSVLIYNRLTEKRAIFMETVVCARGKDTSCIAAASSKFDGFRREPLHDARKPKVKSNPTIEAMGTAWLKCGDISSDDWALTYDRMLNLINKFEYSAKDVEDFSLVLIELQEGDDFQIKAGFFLSALINNCHEDDFVINTAHLDRLIDRLGWHNTKNITVEGSVGAFAGVMMESGTITVMGNASDGIGFLMKGGTITVHGNTGGVVGWSVEGGEIHLNGDYEDSVGENRIFGKIFHNGVLIAGK